MMRFANLFLVLALTGCVPPPGVRAPAVSDFSYTIGPGDRLKISTYGEDRLSGEFAVGADGTLAFPLLGAISAQDLSVAALRDLIEQRLANEALRDPRVSIEVLQYRPVFILGEVERPGEYAFVPGMTVRALVAKAGGFSYRADDRAVFITRGKSGTETRYDLDSATAVAPGDTIRIGEIYL